MNQENQILLKCLKNDRAAQKGLYHSHKDRLMSILFRYTNDMVKAQDLLQESFIKIFTNLEKFDSKKGSFKSWSSRIAINEYLQEKRKRNELVFEDKLPELFSDSESSLLAKLTLQELRIIIEKMPEKDRTILNLFYFESFSHDEISKLLGIKQSSSRSQLSRSRKTLESIWYNLNMSSTKCAPKTSL